jgi:hypothetical protein
MLPHLSMQPANYTAMPPISPKPKLKDAIVEISSLDLSTLKI